MPLAPDRQPLVPPALKRIKNNFDLTCHESTVTAPARPADYLSAADTLQNPSSTSVTSHKSEDSPAEACSSAALCCQGESVQGHQIIRHITLNQATLMKSERQARSTFTGLMSQFSQLHCRRPTLDRLTFAVGSLFGKLCTRRRDRTSSPEEEEEKTERQGVRRDICYSTSSVGPADKDYLAVPLAEEDFLQQTEESREDEDLCLGKMVDASRPQLDRIYSDSIDLDVDLESGEESEEVEVEYDKGGQEKSCDPCFHEAQSAAAQSDYKTPLSHSHQSLNSSSTHRPRKRWTFLSPLSLLHLAQSKSCPTKSTLSMPQRHLNDDDLDIDGCLETCEYAESKLRLDINLDRPSPGKSQYETSSMSDCAHSPTDFAEAESALL